MLQLHVILLCESFFDQNGYHRNTLSDICDKSNDMGANLEKYYMNLFVSSNIYLSEF